MGTYKNGICGPFSGKIGTVVGSSWNGIDYMRSLPGRSGKKPTEAQKSQRMKLALAIAFLRPLSEVVNMGFKNVAVQKTGFNAATSHLITEAISGIYPDFKIDYSKVLISMGSLTGAWNAGVSSVTGTSLLVNWENNSGAGTARTTDRVLLVVYNSTISESLYLRAGNTRDSGLQTFVLPSGFAGHKVHVWISFISVTNIVSTSIYAGSIEIH